MGDFARSADPAVQAELDLLSKLSPGGDILGLERITRLLDRLGRPQDQLPPVLHVAGTNGKGSTCAFLRAATRGCRPQGPCLHQPASGPLQRAHPHRRQADRGCRSRRACCARCAKRATISSRASSRRRPPLAFLAFARTPADACIVEVGLGGRLDATNVIERPLVTAITSLGLDHQQFLGRKMSDIAGEKAGIAKARRAAGHPAIPAADRRPGRQGRA